MDIFDIIGNVNLDNYCTSEYRTWEKEVAEPKLTSLGYEIIGWETTDEDSFGPLGRKVTCRKDGKEIELHYG